MNFKLRTFYAADSADGGGFGGVEKDFDYSQVESALTTMEGSIGRIMSALENKITVTSYQGAAQEDVEANIDLIRTKLAKMESPLKEMQAKITEVKNAYAESEAGIKSALSGISDNAE